MYPGRHQYAPDALSQDCDIPEGYPECPRDVVNELIDVLDKRTNGGLTGVRFVRGASMSTSIPREHSHARQIKLVYNMLQTARVLMAPVKKNQRTGRDTVRRPMPIEQPSPITRAKETLLRGAHSLGN